MARGLFRPIYQTGNELHFYLDEQRMAARSGETVASAVLRERPVLGCSEFDRSARAGFCLMGACQDCTLWTEAGERLRACTTFVEDGARLFTSSLLARP